MRYGSTVHKSISLVQYRQAMARGRCYFSTGHLIMRQTFNMQIRKSLLALALMATVPCYAFAESTSDHLARFQQQLRSSDPTVRVSGLEELVSADPATLGNDVLPILCK